MGNNKIQETKPKRTCDKNYANHSSFKPYLRDDFNMRCGYCDCDDYHAGGSRGYQIDHFKPQSQFKALKNNYANLVYSCPFCNRSKWDKWKDTNGFIDPCSNEYEDHLYRDEIGTIHYHTERGRYIYEELKLGLGRHQVLWMIRKLEKQRDALNEHLNKMGVGDEKELEVLKAYRDIQNKVNLYTGLFRKEI